MSDEEQKYRQIEKYLAGRMDQEELSLFELQLKDNPELKKDVDLHKEIGHAITEDNIINFRKSVKKVINSETGEDKNIGSRKWGYLRIAASISIIMILTFGIYKMFYSEVSNEQLYTAYYEPYQDLITGRSNENNDENLAIAMRFYSQQQYLDAAEYLEKIDKTDKPLIYLYLGISYMNIGKTDKAFASLNVVSKANNLFQIEAKWYVALNYLKEGDINKCKVVLEEIIAYSESSSYKLKSKNLLKEL